MITRYTGNKGRTYTPGKEMGRGGEGAVYEVKENPLLVMKVYTEVLEHDKILKLHHMVTLQDATLNNLTAWPQDLLRDAQGTICGFTMRRLDGFVPLHMLFSPIDRKRLFPDKGYNFLVHVARNLATAFHKIHQAGIIIGDVNEGNILVNAQGIINLIDCDSFQVRNGNTFHFCEVGIMRYTPPELLNRGTFNDVVRTTTTDSFSLSVLIFQLLFLGRHPFTGVNASKEDIDEEKAIRTLEFAYSLKRRNKKLTPARNSLELQGFTPGVIDGFHRAFETLDQRPSAAEWVKELDALGKEMVTCAKTSVHQYPRAAGQCPWCGFIARAGIVFFLDDSDVLSSGVLNDIDQFINGYKVEHLHLKKLTSQRPAIKLKPAAVDPQFRQLRSKYNKNLILGTLVCSLAAIINPFFILIAVLYFLAFSALSPAKNTMKRELDRRRIELQYLDAELDAVISKYNNPPELQQYQQVAGKLSGIISNYKGLHTEFANVRRTVDELHYNRQLQQHLQRFEIRQHAIPSFGVAKKTLLYMNGITTAADISKLQRIKIASIGPKTQQALVDWQRQMGATFAYIPDIAAITVDMSTAMNEIGNKRKKYEEDIKTEYRQLQYLKTNVLSQCLAIERTYQATLLKVCQAETDVAAFAKFVR